MATDQYTNYMHVLLVETVIGHGLQIVALELDVWSSDRPSVTPSGLGFWTMPFSVRYGRSVWVPFRDGYFLSEALGLDGELEALFRHADVDRPDRKDNYFLSPHVLQRGLPRKSRPRKIGPTNEVLN